MSDQRPIGIFDSGLGGLTVAKEIYKVLPFESTIYIGDTARVPYGNRSPETVTQFSLELTQRLLDHQVKAIVVACATASSIALELLAKTFPQTPIIGVIKPAAMDALEDSSPENIGIIGTRATINSHSFELAINELNSKITLQSKACPLFVPIIEEGIIENNPILLNAIDHYLSSFKEKPINTLILGCTHYPLIENSIQAYLPNVRLINAGKSLAHNLKQLLADLNLQTDSQNTPEHTYFATDINDNFIRTARLFLGKNIEFQKIAI